MSLESTLLSLQAADCDESQDDCCDAIRNLILLIGSLTTCGFIELKPSSINRQDQSGFRLPRPMGRGVSVRNIPTYLQSLHKEEGKHCL